MTHLWSIFPISKHCSISIPRRICKSPTDMIGNRVQFTILAKVIGEKSQNKVNIFFNIFHIKQSTAIVQLPSFNYFDVSQLVLIQCAAVKSILHQGGTGTNRGIRSGYF